MNYAPVSLLKRLLAIIYDLLLLIAICFTTGVIMNIFTTFIVNNGNAITEEHSFYLANQIIVFCTIILTSFLFFGWFWSHGGQTLGMKTWKMKLISKNGENISWKQAAIRYFSALISWCVLGLGFLWCLIDKNKRCWHDILSSSYLVQLEIK